MIPVSTRFERTIAKPAEVEGIGFITGAFVHLRFCPAAPGTGIQFLRTDIAQSVPIRAHVGNVTGTQRRTTLGEKPFQVTLVEHVLAALAALRVDNCLVELNAVEPPGLDGSCLGFIEALKSAGSETQSSRRTIYSVESPVILESNGATLALHPCEGEGLKLTYFLDYGNHSPIHRQVHTLKFELGNFIREVANCRTFLLEEEASQLRLLGLGCRTTTQDLLVFGKHGPIDNELRFANEPARHKILDMVGDLALLGADLRGHVVAFRSGHPLNVEMARTLAARLGSAAAARYLLAA